MFALRFCRFRNFASLIFVDNLFGVRGEYFLFNKGSLDRAFFESWILSAGGCLLFVVIISFTVYCFFFTLSSVSVYLPMVRGVLSCFSAFFFHHYPWS